MTLDHDLEFYAVNGEWRYYVCKRCKRTIAMKEAGKDPGPCDSNKSMGLGDTIAKVTKAVGIKKPCKGCRKRQKDYNERWPYKGG